MARAHPLFGVPFEAVPDFARPTPSGRTSSPPFTRAIATPARGARPKPPAGPSPAPRQLAVQLDEVPPYRYEPTFAKVLQAAVDHTARGPDAIGDLLLAHPWHHATPVLLPGQLHEQAGDAAVDIHQREALHAAGQCHDPPDQGLDEVECQVGAGLDEALEIGALHHAQPRRRERPHRGRAHPAAKQHLAEILVRPETAELGLASFVVRDIDAQLALDDDVERLGRLTLEH